MAREFTIDGKGYSLAHLDPVERRIQISLRGIDQKKSVLVEFRFSCHCYSRGLSDGEVAPSSLLIADGSLQKPRYRVFDVRRYQLSLNLIGHIDALIAADGVVRKSRHHNFFSVHDALENIDGNETTVDYFIYMSARKVAEAGQEKRIKMYIESAYPESVAVPSPGKAKKGRSLSAQLGEVWSGG